MYTFMTPPLLLLVVVEVVAALNYLFYFRFLTTFLWLFTQDLG